MVKGCLPVAMPPQHFVLPTCLPYCGTLKSRWAETVRLLLLVPAPPLAAHEVLLTPQVAGGTPVVSNARVQGHESTSPTAHAGPGTGYRTLLRSSSRQRSAKPRHRDRHRRRQEPPTQEKAVGGGFPPSMPVPA
jgi:hypothetical protein